jgi:membrane protein required for colicin V production|tara:strand:+ start:575 stop:1048 length:474 start_codon:yes stop_codon:yes gene_type:complete
MGISIFIGWQTGLVKTLALLGGILLGIAVGSRYFSQSAKIIESFTDNDNASSVLGFLLIFLLVLISFFIFGSLLKKTIKILMLGALDNVGGALVGFLLSIAFMSSLLQMIDQFPIMGLNNTIEDSSIASFLVEDFDRVLETLNIFPENLSSKIDSHI